MKLLSVVFSFRNEEGNIRELVERVNSSLDKLLSSRQPTILEIYGRHDQAYMEVAATKNIDGKLVRRPLEDQWPFLDRDLFKKEMLIEPIDL